MGGPGALEAALEERRRVVRKRWKAIADDMDISVQHLNKIRKGKVPLTEFTAAGIDTAVDWPVGEAWRIYQEHGGFPEQDPPPEPLLDDAERQIWNFVEVSEEERWAYILKHRELQRERERRAREAG